jgi:tRNA A37 threonylcarbamoyladenosine biosynthesis protein TsaE
MSEVGQAPCAAGQPPVCPTHLVAGLHIVRDTNPGVPMARRNLLTHSWRLISTCPLSVPNARIALALLRCVRRMPGAVPEMNFDDLGATLAPAIASVTTPFRAAIVAQSRRSKKGDIDLEQFDLDSPSLLHDRRIHTVIGEALSRALPTFKAPFDKLDASLAAYVARHAHPLDRNVETLTKLLALPAPEAAFLRLAAAFSYGSIDRNCFTFVDSTPRLIKAIELLCDVRGTDARRIFDADRPLARSGLFEALSGKRQARDLEDMLCLSSIGERLVSCPYADAAEMAAAVLTPLKPRTDRVALQWPHLEQSRMLVATALAKAIETGEQGFNVLLHGAPGTGKTEFARALVAGVGGSGFSIDHTDEHGEEASRGDRLTSLRLSQTFASQHHRAVLVLDEAEDVFQADSQHPLARIFRRPTESKSWTNHLLENNPHPVIWISNAVGHLDPAYLRRFAICLEFPKTPFRLRRLMASDQLSGLGCGLPTIDAVATTETVTPALLASAARFAQLTASSGLGPDAAVRTLIDQHARASGRNAAPLIARRVTRFDLRYLHVAGTATPERLLQALRSGEPASLVFSGPPGTGKTQFAAEIAAQLGRELVVRTASDINTKWYGESEANVARMFRDTDPKTELLFLDEAEVLLSSRMRSSHRADHAVTAEFLRWLEAFEGIFICATNHLSDFDAALMRRFTFKMEFKPLDRARREALYSELALGAVPGEGHPAAALDAAASSRLGRLDHLTPGDFANVSRRIRQLGFSAEAWLDELELEHSAKSDRAGAPIGFT